MGCEIIKLKDGFATICSRGGGVRNARCAYCSRPSSKLCDFIVAYRAEGIAKMPETCDKRLCGQCAQSIGPDKDHCRAHGLRGDKEATP